MIRTILHYPDPRLRKKASRVADVSPAVLRLLDDMAETMYAAPGVGLAANQIGEDYRIFIVDIAAEDEPSKLIEFINPEIVHQEGEQSGTEGCLSFPGVSEELVRRATVRVRAHDRHGRAFDLTAEGLLAVAIQHEFDHLEGVLMIDRMGIIKRRIVQKKMAKRGASAPQSPSMPLP